MNQYLKRKQARPIGRAGVASEKKLAKKIGGRPTPASGAMVGAKGDIVLNRFLMEAKSSTAGSLSLKLDWLAKISREAMQQGKRPALSVSFVHDNGDPQKDGQWVMVPLYVFQALMVQHDEVRDED